MTLPAVIATCISEAVSLTILVNLWHKHCPPLIKIFYSVIALIPFVGPFLYWFATDSTPAQPLHQQNRGPRGNYSQRWIASRDEQKRQIEQLQEEIRRQQNESGTD